MNRSAEDSLRHYFRSVFCPHDEFRIIRQMRDIAGEGLQCMLYKRYFDSLDNAFKAPAANKIWYEYTVNAYYDAVVRDWCMLFCSYAEPTHYTKLLDYPGIKDKLEQIIQGDLNAEDMRNFLLKNAGIDLAEYGVFHQTTKDYRDQFLIHREHHPDLVKEGSLSFPKLDNCHETLISIYLLLIQLAGLYPKETDKSNSYEFIYYDLSSRDQLKTLMNKNFIPLTFIPRG